jgi:hypothetical protein
MSGKKEIKKVILCKTLAMSIINGVVPLVVVA